MMHFVKMHGLGNDYVYMDGFSTALPTGDAALKRLAQHLQIPVSRTMSAGDQDNDISMLEAAGLGVAMCNGSQRARDAADVITKTDNNHDGLVPFLESFFEL